MFTKVYQVAVQTYFKNLKIVDTELSESAVVQPIWYTGNFIINNKSIFYECLALKSVL